MVVDSCLLGMKLFGDALTAVTDTPVPQLVVHPPPLVTVT